MNFSQSIWMDSLRRSLIRNGELKRLIEEEGLKGLTSNPAIFEKAIVGCSDYDEQIARLLEERDWDIKRIYENLAVRDIQDAADLFQGVYDRTQGGDGYVSLEVSPDLARNTQGTVEEARRLWGWVNRRNVMIKVPATKEGVPAIRQLISEGINVNVTLLFSQLRYEQVADAYLSGLEEHVARQGSKKPDLSRIASVASFFVSRIDTLTDSLIEDRMRSCGEEGICSRLHELKGKVAIANAKLTYQRYLKIYKTDRWRRLAALGARSQRLLWASTGTKNPNYSDVLYVEELIGPETVTTLPPATYSAFRSHGKTRPSLTERPDQARAQLETLEDSQIHLEQICDLLVDQGVAQFSEPFEKLLGALEKKRRELLGDRMNFFSYDIPAEMNLIVGQHLGQWTEEGLGRRIWRRDPSVWTGSDEANWLAWLDAAENELERTDELMGFADRIRNEGFRYALLLGMGGSSLAPDLFSRIFEAREGYLQLRVLDSTDPEQIRKVEDGLDLKSTLFIVSSKSGSTLEPNILFDYFLSRLKRTFPEESGTALGQRFVAVTDPGSSLEKMARRSGFRKVFHGDPGIGGRYSALSDFGMLPAALTGLDVRTFLERACLMVNSCSEWSPPKENPGVHLGVALGVLSNHGRNKLTFVSSPEIRGLELWLEQLVAESTGKYGKGLIPIVGEELSCVESYGSDRIFVYLKLEDSEDPERDRAIEECLIRLQESGQPVFRILIRDRMNLGQEFFRWEMATAVCGAVIGIHPFDQPDVEASKVETRIILSEFEKTGKFPQNERVLRGGTDAQLTLYAYSRIEAILGPQQDLPAYLRRLFELLGQADYFAILAYLPMLPEIESSLEELRLLVRDHIRVATCLEFGPRFLHSTGQMYKGGPNEGVFLQLTADPRLDLRIPGKQYDFGTVLKAQALGDLKILLERDRRAVHIHMKKDLSAAIRDLHGVFRQALSEVKPLNNQINTDGIDREWRAGGGVK